MAGVNPRAGAALLLLSVTLGYAAIPVSEVLRALESRIKGASLSGDAVIVWQLRLPRAVMGYLVGLCLGLSGAAFQGVFGNPLADPYLMGVASGAALGASVGISLGVSAAYLPALALLGALGAVVAAVLLAKRGRQLGAERLILAGVVVGSVCGAVTTYLMLQTEDRARQVLGFTLGNLSLAGWEAVRSLTPYLLLGAVTLLLLGRALNMLQLGEFTARSLGLSTARLRLVTIAAASLCTAAAVSQVGIIGFVGLVTPHVARRLWGSDYRALLPLSALLGGCLLLGADLLARLLIRPAELPIGILTTLLGGPFFLYLLRQRP